MLLLILKESIDMTQEKKKLTRADWFGYIKEQEESGISQVEFCKQKELSASQFSYYRSLHIKSLNQKKIEPSFTPIAIKQKISTNIDPISIELPNGFRCQVTSDITADQLKTVIGALLQC
jgi:hypothetical protein